MHQEVQTKKESRRQPTPSFNPHQGFNMPSVAPRIMPAQRGREFARLMGGARR